MNDLLWALLGYVVLPIWLLAGVLDYWLHQRTDIATTAGPRESRLHLAQTLQVGIPVLIVLFLELNLLALALLVAAAVAHTITAYWDVRYASQRRTILPLEQVVHAFMFTLPLFVTAVLVIMHWPAVHTSTGLSAGDWALRLRDPPWDTHVVVTVLVASFVFGVVPTLAEYWQVRSAARSRASASSADTFVRRGG
jgi:hypothetical protein